MSMILASLLPIFLIQMLGWALQALRITDARDWAGFEKVCYYVFFPAIVTLTLARAPIVRTDAVQVGGALVIGILSMTALLLAARPLLERSLGIDGPRFTSVFQGATRWNTFVAIAMAHALHGERGVVLIAIAIAAMVPLLNVLSVLILLRYGQRSEGMPPPTARSVFLTILRNPFVGSCIAGLALNLSGLPLPAMLVRVVDMLGQPALVGGLLVVGAGLQLRALARPGAAHLLAITAKLMLMPLIVGLAAHALGAEGASLTIAVMAAAVPSASASYIMARRLGGDAPVMAEIMTLQTLAAILTLPIAIGWSL